MENSDYKYNGDQPFVQKLEALIEANLDNEQFGVEQLAEKMNVSRSHLHRKLQKSVGKSVSRFIREFRLERALKLLIDSDITVSEASHAVGFGSPSYFNKCFSARYGYSPGKAKIKASSSKKATVIPKRSPHFSWPTKLLWGGGLILVFLAGFFIHSRMEKEDSAPNTLIDKSVIVMPFKNLSSDKENQYLAEGMVDAISRHLSEIEELQVKSPTALAQFKDKNLTLQQMGTALKVSNMVQGSIQRQNDTLRIEVKLINAGEENQIWAKNYDREFSDLLKIQSDIAENVALALRANLSQGVRSLIHKRSSYNPEAYDNFLKGRNNAGNDSAPIYMKKAIALDSSMPLGYMGMGAQYLMNTVPFVAKLSAVEACELSRSYFDKAFELDPNLAEIHGWRAFSALYCDWDFEAAEERYKTGIESQESVFYLFMYNNFLHFENRHEEALLIAKQIEQRSRHYPSNPMALSYYYTQRYDDGRAYIEERLRTFTSYTTLETSGFFMLNTGEYNRALEMFQKIMDMYGKRLPKMLGWMGAAYAKKEDKANALKLLEELKVLKSKSDAGAPGFYIGVIYSALGKNEEALKWLKIAVDDHEMEVPWLVSEPQLYPLHREPAFAALVKQVGFRPHAYPVELPPEQK